jgi:hypothetical protein
VGPSLRNSGARSIPVCVSRSPGTFPVFPAGGRAVSANVTAPARPAAVQLRGDSSVGAPTTLAWNNIARCLYVEERYSSCERARSRLRKHCFLCLSTSVLGRSSVWPSKVSDRVASGKRRPEIGRALSIPDVAMVPVRMSNHARAFSSPEAERTFARTRIEPLLGWQSSPIHSALPLRSGLVSRASAN